MRGIVLILVASLASGCAIPRDFKELREIFTSDSKCRSLKANETLIYRVRQGDTLAKIGQCYRVSVSHLAAINNIRNPARIKAGQQLRISRTKPYRPRLDVVQAPPRSAVGITWHLPLATGRVMERFSADDDGKVGLTIAGTEGQKVFAAAAGEVVFSGEGPIGYGQLILVQHKSSFLSSYGHNSRLLVRKGDRVRGGQTIALMGSTAADKPQLHFELRYQGKPVNPERYLPPLGRRRR